MSDTDNRKSMDDVLASIRRIVRSEKEPEEAVEQQAPPEPPTETVQAEPIEAEQPAHDDEVDAPLALTPDMRMDAEDDDDAEASTMAEQPTQTTATVAPTIEPASLSGDGKLRGMIREVLLEELSGDQAGELVRSVIRDELVNGEIGGNISQNVMSLIQNEIAKAMGR